MRNLALRLALLSAALVAGAPSAAQPLDYQQPSTAMRAVLDAPALPVYSLSPDRTRLATLTPRRHRPVAELAAPVARLAGVRLNAEARGPALIQPLEALSLRRADGEGAEQPVALPPGGGFYGLRWSPDGQRLLLARRTANGTELWVAEAAKPVLRRIAGLRLNQVLEADVSWLNADELLVLAVPERQGPAPVALAPTGPTVQESLGKVSPEVTRQNLLTSPQDEALFRHLASSQLRRVNLKTGQHQALGAPGLISRIEAVGGGKALLVEQLAAPFSYQLAWSEFARDVSLVDLASGRPLRTLGRIKLRENVPVQGVVTGPRSFQASPQADGSIYWVEALDGGDPNTKVAHRDRLMRLDAPYTGEPREVHKTAGRLSGLSFTETPERALVTEFDRDRVWVSVDWLALDGSAAPRRWQDRSARDRYRDPGTPLVRVLPNGRAVVRVDNGSLLLAGAGASPQGERPFFDRVELASGQSSRLFQASDSHYEMPLTLLPDGRLLTRRETFDAPPNLVLRSGDGFAQLQPLTAVADPTPMLRGIQRERIQFQRPDGVQLSFWLYLPPGHKGKNAGDARPTFVWAYPQEFTDAALASQVSGSTNRFNSFGGTSPLMLLLDGYVVLMDATMPVVGDPKTVNDSFIEQISANAQAIIDKAVELGVSQRDKMVVGGHSYGAFMTANLLAHTDLFKAGIARSGAYNRTLTPFGFQAERRTLWEAPSSYLKLSPFLVADKLKEPILLIHGDADDNVGTFPMQSQRLYQALAGTGGQVRYVSLPHEGHGYMARESQGHVLWEMREWMQRQVGTP